MWIYTKKGHLSIVTPHGEERGDRLMVRGRIKGDIEAIFPGAEVIETPNRDYRYRALLPRGEVAGQLALQIAAVNYTNFKDTIAAEDEVRAEWYEEVWYLMKVMQDQHDGSGWDS